MEQLVYLFGAKQMGWATTTGQYSTDLKEAATFGLSEALARCKKHKAASNILLPVSVDWMDSI